MENGNSGDTKRNYSVVRSGKDISKRSKLLEKISLHFATALGSTAKEFGSSSALTATVT